MYDNLSFELKNQLFFHNLNIIYSSLMVEHDVTVILSDFLKHIVEFFDNTNGSVYLIMKNKATPICSIEEQSKEIEISTEDEVRMVSSHFAIEENDLAFFPSLININTSKIKLLIPLSYNNILFGFITLGEKRLNNEIDYDNILISMISTTLSRIIYYSNNYIDDNHKSPDEMYLKSITDALTGVYIKNYIEQRMTEGLKEAKRYNKPDSFCMVKIDKFDYLRKKLGQQNVNTVIQITGNLIKNFVRKDVDIVGKHSEDSFIILLPSTESKGSIIFSEKLKSSLSKIILEKHPEEEITVSIAVTTLEPKDNNKDDIIKKLHEAIDNSVKLGGNKISINYEDNISEDLSSFEKLSGVSSELLRDSIENPVYLTDEDGNEIDFTSNVHKNWVNIPKRF